MRGREAIDRLSQTEVDVVITSFGGLTDRKGFTVGEEHDIGEKRMNLRPHRECGHVLIAMDWHKIGSGDVPIKNLAEDPTDVLDCMGGRRTYTIVTNRPSPEKANEKDAHRMTLLKKWNVQDGVEVRFSGGLQDGVADFL